MGLIKAIAGAAGGTLADSWKEYFYCDALDANTLVAKGQKRVSRRSSNTKGFDNVITDGSVVAVAVGQCMMIVEGGKIVEVCAEPGEYTYSTGTSPSIFSGNLGEGIVKTFSEIGKRFTFGGEAPKDQRIYYFNTKEIIDNKFGTPSPIPFRVVDKNIGLDIDIAIRCNGIYSYRMENPLLFYTNVCGNVEEEYNRSNIDGQLKAEFINVMQPALAKISEMGIRYSSLPGYTKEIRDAINGELRAEWLDRRGLSIASIAINSVNASKEDEDMIKQLQKNAVLRDPTLAAANIAGAQADAMKQAASNSAGAMTGFMGLGMAQNAGGANLQNLYAMQNNAQNKPAENANTWKCGCGKTVDGNFCPECGTKRTDENGEWKCVCGKTNTGNFCTECGNKKPSGTVTCAKCGWTSDTGNSPKFCPECGNKF